MLLSSSFYRGGEVVGLGVNQGLSELLASVWSLCLSTHPHPTPTFHDLLLEEGTAKESNGLEVAHP